MELGESLPIRFYHYVSIFVILINARIRSHEFVFFATMLKLLKSFKVINMFVILLCGDTRFNRFARWFCIVMGMGTSDGRRYSESTWHFCQSNPRAILSAWQQVRRGWFRWPAESVSSGLSRRDGSTILCKNLVINLKYTLKKYHSAINIVESVLDLSVP